MTDTPSDIRDFRYDIRVFGEIIREAATAIIVPKAVTIIGLIAEDCISIAGDSMPGMENISTQGIDTPDDILRLPKPPNFGLEYKRKVLHAFSTLERYGELLLKYPDTTPTTDLITSAMNLYDRTVAIIEPPAE